MQLSVVIPNYNGRQLLTQNLPQLLKLLPSHTDVVIVDDFSSDGSVEFIKKEFPRVTLIEKMSNNGFATSVNLGVKAAKGDIIVLLNTDVVPQKDFLPPLLKHFADKKIFAVGCLDQSLENGKIVERGRGIGHFERGFLVHARGSVDKNNTLWVSGGSGAFRKSYWQALGEMDEIYNPFYWEDIDLSYRAQKSGYQILFEPKSVVIHEHTKGSIQSKFNSSKIKVIAYRNQFIFVWKNITDTSYVIQHIVWLPYHFLKAIMRFDFTFMKGFLLAFQKLPEILIKRDKQLTLNHKNDKEILSQYL